MKKMLLLLIFLMNCHNSVGYSADSDSVLTFTLQQDKTYQTIQGFGASDAWSIQFVGKNWPTDKRNQIADLLFSMENDSQGNPRGIGLSIWRFNIGAGSARQGDASAIRDEWRRAESFLTADGTYDWNKQSGQQWFVQAAHNRGVQEFIGFVNSPPIILTKNGMAFGDGSGQSNLPPGRYDEYANYMTAINQHFQETGLGFDFLSPINEPQWNWSEDNNQEGCPWQNTEAAAMLKVLDSTIQESGQNVKIEIPETARIDFINDGDVDGRSDQAEFFFGSQSSVKDLPSLGKKIAAHSYFSTWPVNEMIARREQAWNALQQADSDLEYWMSEYCILANNEEIHGGGRDLGMDPALYVARVIHADLVIANASSWQWWLAVSPYDYKDGLVYIDKNKFDGQIYDSKLLWTLGNYSRFIRPGAVRIGLDRSDTTPVGNFMRSGVMASAYLNQARDKVIVVAVNNSHEPRKINLSQDNNDTQTYIMYLTSANANLEKQPSVKSGQPFTIPARSVVTLVGKL